MLRYLLAAFALVLMGGNALAQVVQPPSAVTAGLTAPAYIAGNWFATTPGPYATGSALTVGSLRLTAISVPRAITVTDLATYVQTVSNGASFQMLVYANSASNVPTGTALAACTATMTAAAGTLNCNAATFTGTGVLPAGVYWVGALPDATAGGTMATIAQSNTFFAGSYLTGSSTLTKIATGTSASSLCMQATTTYSTGVFPSASSLTFTECNVTNVAAIFFKVGSVP